MVWLATDRVLVLMLAVVTPALVLTGMGVPTCVPLSKKVTAPMGDSTAVLPGLLAVTVAVKVTTWPETEGLAAEATTVLVLALLTVWVMAGEAGLALKFLSPLV